MEPRSFVCIGIILACSISIAKTPQQLKIEMDTVLPAGMKVRMAWCNSAGSEGVRTAYVYDSDENVIRELTPTSVFGDSRNISKAFVSQDGETVVLKDNSSDAVQTVKFDGTDMQTLFDQGSVLCTWKDPEDAKHCFIASGLPSPYSAGTWIVGIADHDKRQQLTARIHPWVSDTWGFLGCGISVDGKMIGGFYNDAPGLWPNPSGEFISAEAICRQGCNYAMRPTTGAGVYDYGHFWDSHYEICVHNADGTKKEVVPMNCQGDEPGGLYWTNHVDYVTYIEGEGSPRNPILFDLARQRCVALEEDECSRPECSYGSANAILLPKGNVESRTSSVMMRISRASHVPQKLYTIEGRLLPKGQDSQLVPAVRPLRISAGNVAAGVAIGCR